jgi:hypothetical protein
MMANRTTKGNFRRLKECRKSSLQYWKRAFETIPIRTKLRAKANTSDNLIRSFRGAGLEISQERLDPAIVALWRIQSSQQFLVAPSQSLLAHYRYKVRLRRELIACRITDETAAFSEPFPKASTWQSVEYSHHGHYDPGLLDELELAFEYVSTIAVKADYETTHDFHAKRLDSLDDLNEIGMDILAFMTFLETIDAGRLDPKEHLVESSITHEPHQFRRPWPN